MHSICLLILYCSEDESIRPVVTNRIDQNDQLLGGVLVIGFAFAFAGALFMNIHFLFDMCPLV